MPGVAMADLDRPTGQPRRRVGYRIGGSVSRDGDQIAVAAQIFDNKTGIVLWSEKFLHRPEDVGGMEERVAIALSAILRCAFDEQARNRRDMPPEAFSLLLQACDALIMEHQDALEAARALHDAFPDIAGAKTLLALAAAQQATWSELPPRERKQLLETAQQRATEALNAEPRDAKALTALALIETQPVERARILQEALEIEPDLPPALGGYIVMLREVGRLKEALRTGERLLRMSDPRVNGALPQVAFLAAILGDEATENEAIRKYDEVYPGSAESVRWTIVVWWVDPAIAALQLPRLTPEMKDKSNTACFNIVIPAIAAGETPSRLPPECDGLEAHWRARLLARIGDIDGAYSLLNAIPRDGLFTQILFYPEMHAFRHDARFASMVRDLGLVDYWRNSNAWPDFCDEPGLPYNCQQL